MTVTFKSTPENFEKEESGIKNNTFRKVDMYDERFIEIIAKSKLGKGNFGSIKIVNSKTLNSFDRWIKDITFYDGYVIITWENEK